MKINFNFLSGIVDISSRIRMKRGILHKELHQIGSKIVIEIKIFEILF